MLKNFIDKKNLIILLSGIFVIAILFISFNYIQTNIETEIKNALIKNLSLRQIDSVISISSNIDSDLNLLLSKLEILSISKQVKNDLDSSEKKSDKFLEKPFLEMREVFHISALFLLDDQGTIKQIVNNENFDASIRSTILTKEYEQKKMFEKKPMVFSEIDTKNGENNLIIMHPIINIDTENLEGQIGVIVPTEDFFNYYMFSLSSESDFLIVADVESVIIFHPNKENIGTSIFSEVREENEFVKTAQSGVTATKIFSINDVERIIAGHSIIMKDSAIFTLFLGIPTESIISESESLLSLQKNYMLVLLLIVTLTTGIIFFILKRSIELEKEIKLKKFATIGELTSQVAHDLRNPLSVIMACFQLLKLKESEMDEDSKKRFDLIDESLSDISNKIEDMMSFVRTKPLDLQDYQVVKILDGVLERINTPESVKLSLSPSEIRVLCDKEKMMAVFINLINNALEAIDYDGKINVRINESEESVLIEIEDSGPGVPPEILPKIFDPLTTSKKFGTGLGLASCKNIVEQHSGQITVKNNPTIFTVHLPKKKL